MTADAVFAELSRVIAERKAQPRDDSYTCKLLAGGVAKVAPKITEEAAEVIEAAEEPGEEGRQHLIREAADLVYHLLVMLAVRDADAGDVAQELARRFGVSGLEEKRNRGTS